MIAKMRHVTVLCTEASKKQALETLQTLGVLHIAPGGGAAGGPPPTDLASATAALSRAEKALDLVQALPESPRPFEGKASPEEILDAWGKIAAAEGAQAAAKAEVARYSPFGDFDPADAAALAQGGVEVLLFKARAGALPAAGEGGFVRVLGEDAREKAVYGVAVGGLAEGSAAEVVPLPPRPPAAARAAVRAAEADLAAAREALAAFAGCDGPLRKAVAERKSVRDFFAAEAAMGGEGGIAWIEGFCPEETLGRVSAAARERGWGLASRKPLPGETPPTLLRPPRLFRPITALFDMLGIAPGYYEADVSVIFYAFFTIFFAMLIGDAGYGALILALTVFLRLKFRKAASAPFVLLGVFSAATIAWGVLSGTYFGIAPEAVPACMKTKAAAWLAEQSNVMRLCFLLGAAHLTAARLWNAANLWPDTKALAEIGWTGIIWTMYCASCLVVVDGFSFPPAMRVVAPVSTLLVFLFMLKRDELRTDGINLAILPLSIMGCLGDVISYVRLFAVGLASVKVAENFNEMAVSLDLPAAAKVPAVLAILLVGHGLNFAMGALSILVHAVRLNTLEFSNHKGVSWSGFAYEPFRRQGAAAREERRGPP